MSPHSLGKEERKSEARRSGREARFRLSAGKRKTTGEWAGRYDMVVTCVCQRPVVGQRDVPDLLFWVFFFNCIWDCGRVIVGMTTKGLMFDFGGIYSVYLMMVIDF